MKFKVAILLLCFSITSNSTGVKSVEREYGLSDIPLVIEFDRDFLIFDNLMEMGFHPVQSSFELDRLPNPGYIGGVIAHNLAKLRGDEFDFAKLTFFDEVLENEITCDLIYLDTRLGPSDEKKVSISINDCEMEF